MTSSGHRASLFVLEGNSSGPPYQAPVQTVPLPGLFEVGSMQRKLNGRNLNHLFCQPQQCFT